MSPALPPCRRDNGVQDAIQHRVELREREAAWRAQVLFPRLKRAERDAPLLRRQALADAELLPHGFQLGLKVSFHFS